MQRIGYGRIKHLAIAGGEPVLNPPPRVYRDRRLTGSNEQRAEIPLGDFLLKDQTVRMFQVLDEIADGVIVALEIRDGLPCRITSEESVRA